jgi:hypothetical protein
VVDLNCRFGRQISEFYQRDVGNALLSLSQSVGACVVPSAPRISMGWSAMWYGTPNAQRGSSLIVKRKAQSGNSASHLFFLLFIIIVVVTVVVVVVVLHGA